MSEAYTRCASCKGAAHPSTGCQYSSHTLICRACTVRFWVWLRQHTNGNGKRKGGPNFYDHIGCSLDAVAYNAHKETEYARDSGDGIPISPAGGVRGGEAL